MQCNLRPMQWTYRRTDVSLGSARSLLPVGTLGSPGTHWARSALSTLHSWLSDRTHLAGLALGTFRSL